MAARVENYIKFLIHYATNTHESIKIDLRDIVVFPEVLAVLVEGSAKVCLALVCVEEATNCWSSY